MIFKNFAYKIFSEYKYIARYYWGDIYLNDIRESLKIIAKDKLFDPTFSVINILTKSNLNLDEDEIFQLFDFFKENSSLYKKRRSVFITKTPNQTVFAQILENFKDENLISLGTFNSLELAIKWLHLKENDYENISKFIIETERQIKSNNPD